MRLSSEILFFGGSNLWWQDVTKTYAIWHLLWIVAVRSYSLENFPCSFSKTKKIVNINLSLTIARPYNAQSTGKIILIYRPYKEMIPSLAPTTSNKSFVKLVLNNYWENLKNLFESSNRFRSCYYKCTTCLEQVEWAK